MNNEQNEIVRTDTNRSNVAALLLQRGQIDRYNREVDELTRDVRMNLAWSDLRGLDLRGANFIDAFLCGVDSSGSDLRGVNFSPAQNQFR